MGVEPTWDRLTAPPGFEVRSPHRERDSSLRLNAVLRKHRFRRKETDTGRVYPAQVLPPDCEAMAIEELEDLDRHLAAVAKAVAEFSSSEGTLGGLLCELDGNARHGLHCGSHEEMIVGQFLDLAAPGGHAQQTPHGFFSDRHRRRDIAHARRAVRLRTQMDENGCHYPLFFRGEFNGMAGAAHPHAIEGGVAGFGKLPERCGK